MPLTGTEGLAAGQSWRGGKGPKVGVRRPKVPQHRPRSTAHSPISPIQPLSLSGPTLQGRRQCVCRARCHLKAAAYFSVCSGGHVRLVDPRGLLFCCCLIINHLNGGVNSRSHLHPHLQREPRDPFTHHRSKMGYLANKSGQSQRA